MLVKCVTNNINKLDDEPVRVRLAKTVNLDFGDSSLAIGEVYTVFAIEIWEDKGTVVYLDTCKGLDFPHPYHIELFDVVDNTIPADWCIGLKKSVLGVTIKIISFPEWVNDDCFYERLIDGDDAAAAAAVAIYRQRSGR